MSDETEIIKFKRKLEKALKRVAWYMCSAELGLPNCGKPDLCEYKCSECWAEALATVE
jgi:hypothetical protein